MHATAVEQDRIKRAASVLLNKAQHARLDICDFFEFVVREETTREKLKTAPHQRIFFEFAQAHPLSIIMLPIGTSKTYGIATMGMFDLGTDRTSRGAYISFTQAQAAKPMGMIKDYIENSPELHLVFPALRKSERGSDGWTQTDLTVDRPYGIRDPSVVAVGMDSGKIPGSRLKWIYIDDMLNRENVNTKDQRDKIYSWVDTTVLSRLDPKNSRCCITNTAWHPDDFMHRLTDQGWPTLRMEIDGNIEILNTTWNPKDVDALRPEVPGSPICRLSAHDPDPRNEVPLFPERVSREAIEELRRKHLPLVFNQLYRNIVRDDNSSMCKQEYIDTCLRNAREFNPPCLRFASSYEGPNQTFTGVDLAISPGEEHDDTAFFTFEALPSGHRRILEIEVGQWSGPDIVAKVIDKGKRYKSVVRVENNGAQDYIRQFTLKANVSIPIKAHCTGRIKAHPEYGVASLFIELMNGAWLIPNNMRGEYHEAVKRFIDSCLYYSPAHHTDDVLMACYFAREQAREFGVLSGSETSSMGRIDVMSR